MSICAVCLGLSSTAFAGAWTQNAQGYYLKIAASTLNTAQDIDARGHRIQKPGMGNLTDRNLSAYLEYGLRDRLTLVVSAPYKRLEDTRTFDTGIAEETRSGFGDLEARLRWRVLNRGRLVASVAAGGKVPLWYTDDPNSRVPLSSKKVDADVRSLLGWSLHPFPAYVTGEAGYRVRGGTFSDETFYALEAGITLNRFLLKGTLSGIHTLGPCEVVGEVGLIGDQNVLKLSPGLIYRATDRIELSLELFHITSGCNTTAGNTVSFGIALKK